MEQLTIQTFGEKKHKSFRYYRYKVSEKLHKFVNILMRTNKTYIGHTYVFCKEDLDELNKIAIEESIPQKEKEKQFIETWQKRLIDHLIKQLEWDGYLTKFINRNDDGSLEVGFRFEMLGLKAQQILNDENAIVVTPKNK